MTDSYHFESVAKFRVGGVYRQQNGVVVKLTAVHGNAGVGYAERVHSPSSVWKNSGGHRQLSDGRYLHQARNAEYDCHLIPGELIERCGEWVPQDAPIVFPSGATLKTSGDKIVGRVEAQTLANGLTAEETDATASVMGIVGKRTEPNRAPLPHFNQRTPHDTFGPDFIVTKGEVPTAPLHTSSTTDSAYPAIAGLLRG